MRQHKMDKGAKFMEIKSIKPKIKQSGITRELKISSSTLHRYRRETNMLSPYGIPPSSNTHTRKQMISNHIENDLKMDSKDLKMNRNGTNENDKPVSKKVNTKNCSRGGDPNDDNHFNGRDFIEQAFSST